MIPLDDASPLEAHLEPPWRWQLGHAVGAYGTALLIVPALFMAAFAHDAKDGRCDANRYLLARELPPGVTPGTCDITAAGGYAVMMLLLVGPTVVGLLIRWPRHVGWWLGAVLTIALVVYLLLVTTGETVRPGPA
ncbi:hypothetical protein [Oerskovia turbata]